MPPNIQAYQRQIYNIGIFEEETILTVFENGGEQHYAVSENELARLLSIKKTFVLKPDPGLLLYESKASSERFVFDVPPRKKPWSLILREDVGKPSRVVEMRLPGFVLDLGATTRGPKRHVKSVSAFCYAGRRLTQGATLYEMPLPNFSKGRMCTGGIEMTVLEGASVLQAGLDLIFESEFNNHSNLIGRRGLPFPRYHEKYGGRAPLSTLQKLGHYKDPVP